MKFDSEKGLLTIEVSDVELLLSHVYKELELAPEQVKRIAMPNLHYFIWRGAIVETRRQ